MNIFRNRKLIVGLWLLTICAVVVVLVYPINNGLMRLAAIGAFAGVLAGPLILWWKSRPVRVVVVCAVLIPLLLLALPGRSFSRPALRLDSVASVESFEGTEFVWGGEGRMGVDCSGLVRQGFIRANFKQGIPSLNGALLRRAVSLWWFDSSAKALRAGYRGETERMLEAPSVNAVPTDRILPGDFAVTSDGIHVMVYVGGNRWTEADPAIGRVVTIETPSDNPFFNKPVDVVRWKSLRP
ncbi:MAG TPA: NlpC/P60 family protein [Actinomycetota bacterium]|nr:NlpC/P60 family protein [Actinomycetota bacterium]